MYVYLCLCLMPVTLGKNFKKHIRKRFFFPGQSTTLIFLYFWLKKKKYERDFTGLVLHCLNYQYLCLNKSHIRNISRSIVIVP